MPLEESKAAFAGFVTFVRGLRGDEKSEAQTFLDHFFRALGHGGVIEAGATFEFRVAKKPGSAQLELIVGGNGAPKAKGGKKFADLLWADRVLIEMKRRGEHLERHYDQLFDYWTHIVPKRPPYAILCNFDEFWVYDFNTQLFDPVDRIKLDDLPNSLSTFNFLLPVWKKPIFGNNWVDVTRRAADQMATVFRELVDRGEDRMKAQRFILQLLVAMVAEDIGLLPDQLLSELLHECAERGASSFDLIGGLFRQMASPQKAGGGRFTEVQYFNGGLFAQVDPIELKHAEAYRLCESAAENWAYVRPEIFGALFQDSMDKKERHAFGAHFTSEFDIRKVVGPTIVRPWRERIEAAGKNVGQLRGALADLRKFRVLDPACGSGNFLFIAYREMKRLERDLLLRLREVSRKEPLESAISLHQFYGLDILPFAVELAKVTLMLAKELELEEAKKLAETDQLLIEEKPLPLDNLDKNIVCADALFTDWPKADAIIGNPPYLGSKLLKPTYGIEYVEKLRKAYPAIPGRADYCVYWFRKTHDQLSAQGHAGLVGTQNVRNNYSRIGGLDYIVANGGTITDAVSAQVWSGEAAVHVSIVNWEKEGKSREPFHLSVQRGDSTASPWETFELPRINSSLSAGEDVTSAVPLRANREPQRVFNGQFPRHEGFVLEPDIAFRMIAEDPRNAEVIHPFLIGREMLVEGEPQRYVIDFQKRDLFEARSYKAPFEHVQAYVLPHVQKLADTEQQKTGKHIGQDQTWLKIWWQHFRCRKEFVDSVEGFSRYIACSAVTKRPVFAFVSTAIRPDHALYAFAFEDDYSFSILQSSFHWLWFVTKCSKLLGRFRYTPDTVFDTFPWPQNPTKEQIRAVADAAVALRKLRRERWI
ncbi:MAG: class I SAM-dependent DNA methyltransferase, partial [Chthoniobacterales bacterium]|nr:class I SAM-dependent DNA methyltransferase [Chthoniobacterales bacterium]